MNFWALAYVWQEDIFYDFEEYGDTHNFSERCLLPTKDMAIEYIENELSVDYEPVKITIDSLNNGALSYSRGFVKSWDEIDI